MTEIKEAVESSLKECAKQIRTKITKKQAVKERRDRKKNLFKHIPDAARAIHGVLRTIAKRDEPSSKRARLFQAAAAEAGVEISGVPDIISQVARNELTQSTFSDHLRQCIEKQDTVRRPIA